MRLDDLLRISFRQVLRQRRRNLGVALAIALGTAGLVVVITMGQDIKENINKDLELIGGATRIKLYFEDLKKYSVSRTPWFRESTARALRRIPKVTSVSLTAFMGGKTLYTERGRRSWAKNILAVDEFYWEVNSFSPVEGRFFGTREVANREKVCVLGVDLARRLYRNQRATGRLLSIEDNYYRVIGVLGGVGIFARSNFIFIPITTAQDRIAGFKGANHIYVRCHTWDDVEAVAAAIAPVVRSEQPAQGLRVEVARTHLKQVRRTAWFIRLFVILSVSATFILGGFGIWNIMMAGVRSRTREIGLKKAIGAEDRDIMAQFMAESLCLSLIPAAVGILLGRAAIEVLASMLGTHPPEELFFFCVGMGFAFALALGVGAGLSPSIKASRMEVVSALRYE